MLMDWNLIMVSCNEHNQELNCCLVIWWKGKLENWKIISNKEISWLELEWLDRLSWNYSNLEQNQQKLFETSDMNIIILCFCWVTDLCFVWVSDGCGLWLLTHLCNSSSWGNILSDRHSVLFIIKHRNIVIDIQDVDYDISWGALLPWTSLSGNNLMKYLSLNQSV